MSISRFVHLKNKYPGGRVIYSADAIDAFCAKGYHRVALRKDGNGDWVDFSATFGCQDKWDASPIPKETRAVKHGLDGRAHPDEEHVERRAKAAALASQHGGRVPSIKELLGREPKVAEIEDFRLPTPAPAPKPAPAPAAETPESPPADQSV